MRQLSNREMLDFDMISKEILLISVFADNLEKYVFPDMSFKWKKREDTEEISSIVFLHEKEMYLIQNFESYSNLYVYIPKISPIFIPKKIKILKMIETLNIKDQLVWFNEWWYLPKRAKNLRQEIAEWIDQDLPVKEIKERTAACTRFEEQELKYLLSSHPGLAGSVLLQEMFDEEK